jgi:hypothetical protein
MKSKYTKSLRFVTRLWGPSNTVLVGVDGRHGGLLSLAECSDSRKKLSFWWTFPIAKFKSGTQEDGTDRGAPTDMSGW